MTADKEKGVRVVCWVALAIVIACLGVAMWVSGSTKPVAKSSLEITQVVGQLDSVDSLKTILVTFANQYQLAEEQWERAVSILTFLLFLVSMAALALVGVALASCRRLRQLRRQQSR